MSRREHQQLLGKRGKVHKKRTLSALPCICQFSTAFALFVLSCIFVLLIIFAVLDLQLGVVTILSLSLSSPHPQHHYHRYISPLYFIIIYEQIFLQTNYHRDQGDCVVGLGRLGALVTRVDKIYTERARTACQQYALLIIMIIVVILMIVIIIIIIHY